MTDDHEPREREDLERETTPELDKETLKDLDIDTQGEEVKGGTSGRCGDAPR
jgi:hypothetical protein